VSSWTPSTECEESAGQGWARLYRMDQDNPPLVSLSSTDDHHDEAGEDEDLDEHQHQGPRGARRAHGFRQDWRRTPAALKHCAVGGGASARRGPERAVKGSRRLGRKRKRDGGESGDVEEGEEEEEEVEVEEEEQGVEEAVLTDEHKGRARQHVVVPRPLRGGEGRARQRSAQGLVVVPRPLRGGEGALAEWSDEMEALFRACVRYHSSFASATRRVEGGEGVCGLGGFQGLQGLVQRLTCAH
jgi:hypothetical protein